MHSSISIYNAWVSPAYDSVCYAQKEGMKCTIANGQWWFNARE